MKRTVLFLAIAIISVASLAAENVKAPTYIINGKKVENFDGSQLKGKTIANYTIDEGTNVHVILTVDYVAGKAVKKVSVFQSVRPLKEGESITSSEDASHYLSGEAVFVLDGKLVSVSKFTSLKPSALSTVKVIKDKNNADFKKYAEEAKKQSTTGVEPKCIIMATSKYSPHISTTKGCAYFVGAPFCCIFSKLD